MKKFLIAAFMLLSSVAHANGLEPLSRANLYLTGVVSDDMAQYITRQIRTLNEGGVQEIVLHITSPGGSVLAGLQIYDAMQESQAIIHTSCEGYCMSMAAVLLCAGNIRDAGDSSIIMFHGLSTMAGGKVAEIEQQLEFAKKLQLIMDKHISKHSGLSLFEVRKMEAYDHFMTAQEAKELNLIDFIRPTF